MREFAIIDGVFAPMARSRPEVLLGMGDDAAILAPGSGEHWCWSIDTLVEGVHFAVSDAPEDIGWKSLAVNLSDLAAMGARPVAVLLALTLPDGDGAWVRAFARGFDALAAQHGVCLAGGDTTRGPRSISVTVMGALPAGSGLRRDGAREGDIIAVTGTLGDAALALRLGARADADLRARLHRPMPRLAAGQALRGLAHAAVDVSDGLLADLGHVMRASGTAAAVRADLLPASKAFADAAPPQDRGALQAVVQPVEYRSGSALHQFSAADPLGCQGPAVCFVTLFFAEDLHDTRSIAASPEGFPALNDFRESLQK